MDACADEPLEESMRNADNLLPAASVPVLPRLLLEKRARRFSPNRVIAAPGAPSGETRGDPGDEPEEDFFLPPLDRLEST